MPRRNYVRKLREAIRAVHGCEPSFVSTCHVKALLEGETAWEKCRYQLSLAGRREVWLRVSGGDAEVWRLARMRETARWVLAARGVVSWVGWNGGGLPEKIRGRPLPKVKGARTKLGLEMMVLFFVKRGVRVAALMGWFLPGFLVPASAHGEDATWKALTFQGLSLKTPMALERLAIDRAEVAKMESVAGLEIYQGTMGGLLVVAEVFEYEPGLHVDPHLAMKKAIEMLAGNVKAVAPAYEAKEVVMNGQPALRVDSSLTMANPDTGEPLQAPIHVVVMSAGPRVAQVMVVQVENEEVDGIRTRKILDSLSLKREGEGAKKGLPPEVLDGEGWEPFTVGGLTVKTPLQFVKTPNTERTVDGPTPDQVSFESYQGAGTGLQVVLVVTKYRKDGLTDLEQAPGFVLRSLCEALDVPLPEYTVDKVKAGAFEAREVHANLAAPNANGGASEPMPVSIVLVRSARTMARVVILQTLPGEAYARHIVKILQSISIAKREFTSSEEAGREGGAPEGKRKKGK